MTVGRAFTNLAAWLCFLTCTVVFALVLWIPEVAQTNSPYYIVRWSVRIDCSECATSWATKHGCVLCLQLRSTSSNTLFAHLQMSACFAAYIAAFGKYATCRLSCFLSLLLFWTVKVYAAFAAN